MADDELYKIRLAMHDLRNDLENVSVKLHETNEALEKLTTQMGAFMEKADRRFAGKWTEKLLVAVCSAIGLAVVAALMAQILK